MDDGSEKENASQSSLKEVSKSRRRLTTPVHKIMSRISSSGDNKKSEISLKSRLSFQNWRRRKSTRREAKHEGGDDGDDREDKDGKIHEPLVRTALRPNAQSPDQTRRLKRREPLKAAPLAESEDIDLTAPKKAKIIASAARRLTAFTTTTPLKVGRSFHKKRVTEHL